MTLLSPAPPLLSGAFTHMHHLKQNAEKSQQLMSGDLEFELIREGIKAASALTWSMKEVWAVPWYLSLIVMDIAGIDLWAEAPQTQMLTHWGENDPVLLEPIH